MKAKIDLQEYVDSLTELERIKQKVLNPLWQHFLPNACDDACSILVSLEC